MKIKDSESLKIVVDGYLKGSRLDKEGGKTIVLEYSAQNAVEIAKIELMGRDLDNHLPILLRTTYEISTATREPKAKKQRRKAKQKRYDFT